MSINKNQLESIIYQLVRKLHNNDLYHWYIRNNPDDFEYTSEKELGYFIEGDLVSLVKLENDATLIFDKEINPIQFLNQLMEDATVATSRANSEAYMYYLQRVENL